MKKANEDVRKIIHNKRIYHYELANALGVSEATLCRWLRTELPEQKKAEVYAAIALIQAERQKDTKDTE